LTKIDRAHQEDELGKHPEKLERIRRKHALQKEFEERKADKKKVKLQMKNK
jgi:hypothetical protein